MKRAGLTLILLVPLLSLGCSAPQPRPPAPEAAALGWLLEHQTLGGGWGTHAATAMATEALERFGEVDAAVRGRAWLGAVPAPRDPLAAAARVRLFESATLSLRNLEGAQRGDGRWQSPGWPDALVTAAACAALERAGADADRDALLRGREWLLRNAEAEGWALGALVVSARAAARRVRAAKAAGLLDPADVVEAAALEKLGVSPRRAATLAAAHRYDTEWPERAQLRALRAGHRAGPADLLGYVLTSEALASARPSRRRQWRRALREALSAQQRPDGSWGGSAVATAAALLALAR